ncbi:CHAD domain-containing protein [Mycobacterium terramassiliense]|nr:CHAD domain-containing protein [Mycobacterium terramassiliense]
MRSPATRALTDYLNAQIGQIQIGDSELRGAENRDTIHDTRVATRRFRSTLRVFAKILDAGIGDLDRELKWYAGLLGDVRDCQVQGRRFDEALDAMPEELILGPVRSRIRNDLQAIELPARARLSEAMDSDRYHRLQAALRRWRDEPPVDQRLSAKALRKRARRAQRKADRRLAAALDSGDDVMLHRARKAAKRARYAAELGKPLDQGAGRTIKHYKRIQGLLGDHQDTVVATEALRQMAVTAGTTVGENGFSYGVLYARELQIARRCREGALQLV